MSEIIERVAKAIEGASEVRAFGLYDYSQYKGAEPPHAVWDEIARKKIFASWDKDEARAKYEECCRNYIAEAAIEAMGRTPSAP